MSIQALTGADKYPMIPNMKTNALQRVAGLCCIGLLVLLPGACKSAGTPMRGGSEVRGEYALLVKTRSVFLYPDAPETSPKLEISLSLLESPRADRQFILNTLSDGLDTDGYGEKRLFGYDKMYGEMRFVVERIPDMSTMALNWFYKEDFAYKSGNSRLAVISRDWEYYTGGAHGMHNRDYYVFSLGDKRRLSLGDIVLDEARPALDNLVEAALRAQMGIPDWIPLSEQGFFEDSPNKLEDFFLSSQGLGFQWDPYEIAPYSMGIIEVVIPYDSLQGMFSPLGLSVVTNIR
jgi:hypothetical protein